jgi:hypothetical protein
LRHAPDGHYEGVTHALRPLLAGLVLVTAVVLGGCTPPVQDLSCPGVRCTAALADVRHRVADLPEVTGVTKVAYRKGLNGDRSGLVVFRAHPRSATAARRLNRTVLGLFRAAGDGLERAASVEIQLTWDPEAFVPHTTEMGPFRESTRVARSDAGAGCIARRCQQELRAVEHRVRAALPGGFRLDRVRLHDRGRGGDPDVVVRLDSDLRMSEYQRIVDVAARVAAVIAGAGLPSSYGERVLVTHPVERTLLTRWTSYDGFTDLADGQAVAG